MNLTCAIGFEDETLLAKATALANTLNLPLDNHAFPRLSVTVDKLVLLVQGFGPLYADFQSPSLQRRRNAGQSQGLIRACRPVKGLRIIDATAGWGRDAALMASFGADVVMIERQPIMAALLNDALSRLRDKASSSHDRQMGTLSLVTADATTYLQSLHPSEYPDVVYIDPMHPSRQKSALVKKDMQVLQKLIGTDEDAEVLLQQALAVARQKVVVKWPQHLPPMLRPNHSFQGKTVRFDIYISSTNELAILL